MQTSLTETQSDKFFYRYYKFYKQILEAIYSKTINNANDKKFAHQYFIQQIYTEIEYHKAISFNTAVVNQFQICYKMGFSWATFIKEVRCQQDMHAYNDVNEIGTVLIENEQPVIESKLLQQKRDVDFIKYVAKYKSVSDYMLCIQNINVSHTVNNKNVIRPPKESIRWHCGKGKKIDLIRLLVALNDCKYFETSAGLAPSQEQVIDYFGEMLSVNLQHFEQDLSNGLESKLHTNIAIFDKLKTAIEKRFYKKVEKTNS